MQHFREIDLHVHTNFSDGEASAVQVLDRAKELGLDCLAITDHYDPFDEHLRKREITEEMLSVHFQSIRSYSEILGLNVLCGVETCTDFKGNLRLSDRIVNLCDIIITSPHYVEYDGVPVPGNYYDERYWERYKEKVLNMARGQGDILGHSEGYLPLEGLLIPGTTTYESRKELCRSIASRYFDMQYIRALSEALGRSGKALELHCATQTPRETVAEAMAKAGIPFSVGSDAHVLDAVGKTGWGKEILERVQGRLFVK